MLVHIEGLNKDGTVRTRVVQTYTDLDKARAHQKLNPELAIHTRTGPPLRQGDVVNIDPAESSDVSNRLYELQQSQKGLNGVAKALGPAAVLNGTAAILTEQNQRPPSLGQ
jgi:hypothetical protein